MTLPPLGHRVEAIRTERALVAQALKLALEQQHLAFLNQAKAQVGYASKMVDVFCAALVADPVFSRVFGTPDMRWHDNVGQNVMVRTMRFGSQHICDLVNDSFDVMRLREHDLADEHEARCEFNIKFGRACTVEIEFNITVPAGMTSLPTLKANLAEQDGEAWLKDVHEQVAILCADVLDKNAKFEQPENPAQGYRR